MKTKNWIYPSYLMGVVFVLLSVYTFGQEGNETVTDIEGNVYNTVVIGTQTWMLEDLKVTKYNGGVPIPCKMDKKAWPDYSGSYCWYNNEEIYKTTNGALYNWAAINTGNLAPKGWHVPSAAEWQILIDYLGGEKIAGGKLKEAGTSHWTGPNEGADNSSGFTALPGGSRIGGDGMFDFLWLGIGNSWWTSSKKSYLKSMCVTVSNKNSKVKVDAAEQTWGLAVRCLKD